MRNIISNKKSFIKLLKSEEDEDKLATLFETNKLHIYQDHNEYLLHLIIKKKLSEKLLKIYVDIKKQEKKNEVETIKKVGKKEKKNQTRGEKNKNKLIISNNNKNYQDFYKNSILMMALKNRYSLNSIKIIINKKTKINHKNKNGMSPLMIALENKYNIDTIILLINKNTDINQINKDENSPLMIALKNKYNKDRIQLLINEKTDINKKNKLGVSFNYWFKIKLSRKYFKFVNQ